MPRSPALALAILSVALTLGCREEPPVERHYPMREASGRGPEMATHAAETVARTSVDSDPTASSDQDTDDPPKLRERPKPDPAIAVTLDMIAASGRKFIDQAEEAESRPTEYTAEQFASMLRSKWDWIGYDIVALDPWLDDIATRSFKSNLPYLVVLEDGRTTEFRTWLDAQRAQAKP